MNTRALLPLALSTLLSGAACGDDDTGDDDFTDDGGAVTVVDVAREAGDFDILVGALEATGLDAALSGEGPYTVFAPTDAAFERLPDGTLDSLDQATLEQILTYHVVAGELPASQVVELDAAATLEGSEVAIGVSDETVVLDGTVQVIETDIAADNGVIHVIDSVLLPPAIAFPGDLVEAVSAYPIFDSLVDAVDTADLTSALQSDNQGDGFTLLAPTNAAFAEVDVSLLSAEQLGQVLLYHVLGASVDSSTIVGLSEAETLEGETVEIAVEDGTVVLNGSVDVIRTDLETDNGIIHVLDGVLLPAAP